MAHQKQHLASDPPREVAPLSAVLADKTETTTSLQLWRPRRLARGWRLSRSHGLE